jgi:hypothetical protein
MPVRWRPGWRREPEWRGRGHAGDGFQPNRHIRPREALRDQVFDLSPGLARRGGQQLVYVPRRQVRRQRHDAARAQPALGQRHEQDRELPRRPRRVGVLRAPSRPAAGACAFA